MQLYQQQKINLKKTHALYLQARFQQKTLNTHHKNNTSHVTLILGGLLWIYLINALAFYFKVLKTRNKMRFR